MTRVLRYLSLGAGVQSTTLALMIEEGEIEPVECAIFADTQWEPRQVYTHLDWLETRLSFPVHRVSAGDLRQHVLDGTKKRGQSEMYRGIPAYTRDATGKLGMLRRQCTREYKIAPIMAKVRELCGLKARQRFPAGQYVEQLVGISADEADRMKPAPEKWLRRIYPLCDRLMTRRRCLEWMAARSYPQPPRSACVGCPLHTRAEWRRIRQDPISWADAVEVDETLRAGLVGGINAASVYLHARGEPLVDTVRDTSDQGDLFEDRGGWGNECDGYCGV